MDYLWTGRGMGSWNTLITLLRFPNNRSVHFIYLSKSFGTSKLDDHALQFTSESYPRTFVDVFSNHLVCRLLVPAFLSPIEEKTGANNESISYFHAYNKMENRKRMIHSFPFLVVFCVWNCTPSDCILQSTRCPCWGTNFCQFTYHFKYDTYANRVCH